MKIFEISKMLPGSIPGAPARPARPYARVSRGYAPDLITAVTSTMTPRSTGRAASCLRVRNVQNVPAVVLWRPGVGCALGGIATDI